MSALHTAETIMQHTIMAGMRGHFPPPTALAVAEALYEEGVRVFELTLNSEQPLEALRALKRAFGDDVLVGMGTVLSVDDARRTLDARPDFLVAPSLDADVVTMCRGLDVLMIPGVITPTEAVQAWALGAPLLKLFPVGALGVPYFKALFGPLAHMRFMCNGAMNAENARAFLQAGAVAVGMGDWLTGDGTLAVETVRARARLLRASVQPSAARTA